MEDLRARHAVAPDPDGLLGDEFTMRELLLAHEAVLANDEIQRDTFRRTMEPQLKATHKKVIQGRGRPAALFRREAATHR